jgi:hypothetical protein
VILTEQKKYDEIVKMLEGTKNVFIVGCGLCATTAATGGEAQVKELAERLKKDGKTIAGSVVVDSTCDSRLCKKDFSAHKDEVEKADAFLVMACGAGVQTVSGLVGKAVFPALNSMFVAKIERVGKYYEMCTTCGDCQLDRTGGICLISRCPKNTLNGPCGGSVGGKCEVDQNNDCAWALIEERLKQINRIDSISEFEPVKDWTSAIRPRKMEK